MVQKDARTAPPSLEVHPPLFATAPERAATPATRRVSARVILTSEPLFRPRLVGSRPTSYGRPGEYWRRRTRRDAGWRFASRPALRDLGAGRGRQDDSPLAVPPR